MPDRAPPGLQATSAPIAEQPGTLHVVAIHVEIEADRGASGAPPVRSGSV